MREDLSFPLSPFPYVRHELRVQTALGASTSVAFDVGKGADTAKAYEDVARLVKAYYEGRFTVIGSEGDLPCNKKV